jgi:carboxymethylenebutenolidase
MVGKLLDAQRRKRMSRKKEEPSTLRAESVMTRRGFTMTTLAVGFAVAVRPLSAEMISTSSEELRLGEVQIPTSDGRIPAYHASPAQGHAFPVVLVVQEIFGVHEHIKDICRRLARLGYLAIAPELYARQGNVSTMTVSWNKVVCNAVSSWLVSPTLRPGSVTTPPFKT